MLAETEWYEQKAAELEIAVAELAGRRFTGESQSGFVTAEVMGDGQLVDLTVHSDALRQAHPQTIGPDTVEAIGRARAGASEEGRARLTEVLGRAVE
jgi:DNA-binding protein YbaB